MNNPVIVERIFQVPVDRLWHALTDSTEIKNWYFDLPGFKPVVGYEFKFTGKSKDVEYKHLCRITEVVPNQKLAYTWKYDGYKGDSLVTFELFQEKSEQGPLTRLRVTHTGLETFPPIADFARKNFEDGWASIITKSLKKFLESQVPSV